MKFNELEIINPILDAVDKAGYLELSPIQEKAIPILLAGSDLLASAQTGTGKTAAFAIPIIEGIAKEQEMAKDGKNVIRALVLSPTRELAEQTKQSFQTLSGTLNVKTGAIYGGVSQQGQERMLSRGIDVLVATPGRLTDLIHQRIVNLNNIKYLVLDEVDTLLDMGFIKGVKQICGLTPKNRQTMMFSATVSSKIAKLSGDLLKEPKLLDMAPPELMLEKISHGVFMVEKADKLDLLLDLLTDNKLESVLVFTRTKHGADKVVKSLKEYGVNVGAIHGNKSQSARQITLNAFKAKKLRVLVATDIAARGIDIDDLSHVINYDLPESPETYVHRIGRTGRKGLAGTAYSFCSKAEKSLLRDIEKFTGLKIKIMTLAPISPDSRFKKIEVSPEDAQKEEKEKSSSFHKDGYRRNNFSGNRSNSHSSSRGNWHRSNETQKTGESSNYPRRSYKNYSEDHGKQNDESKPVSLGEKRYSSDKKQYGERKYSGERRYSSSQKSFGDKKPYGDKKYSGENTYTGEKKFKDDKAYSGERKYSSSKPYNSDKKYGYRGSDSRTSAYKSGSNYSSRAYQGKRSYSSSKYAPKSK